MKFRGEILEVSTIGDRLTVKMQASGKSDANWRPMVPITFQCADISRNRNSLRVGRSVTVEISFDGP